MRVLTILLVLTLANDVCAQAIDDSPARSFEWGFRPAHGSTVARTPPPFSWRPQLSDARYTVQIARDPKFALPEYEAGDILFSVHCPSKVLEPGEWFWRLRYAAPDGAVSDWSQTRSFVVPEDAIEFPLPNRGELLARIPDEHPRLFLRPGQIEPLRERARGELKQQYEKLVGHCEKLLAKPPETAEPPRYPPGVKRGSEEWRNIWWGNRTYTVRVLDGAAQLGFCWRISGREEFGALAQRLLLETAEWDPKGATSYRYNDEAGMPYAYHFSRAYTFVHDRLSDEERATCREVMRIRGNEMYRRLCPDHLWRPYSSHSNRAWHFLGEVAIAFHGEIEEADDWLWFAVNVFANAYPVWSDDDGGWHEGMGYWRSYVSRFTWWADVMREALELDAYRLPFFSKAGDYPLYLLPPGTRGGGFGDLCAKIHSGRNRDLMTTLSGQAGQPNWQWYLEQIGGAQPAGGFIGFLRGSRPTVAAVPPTDLPSSRCFRGTGIAALNSDLLDGRDNVEVIFKSSPFGTQSHGYESQNSFLLYAYGERLLIRSGYRDTYGSDHHRQWMWQTKSTNGITVSGQGQVSHSAAARGEITAFRTTPTCDFVEGEAAGAYAENVKRFSRAIVFVKPDLIVLLDRLEAEQPSTFEWWLHAPVEMRIDGSADIRIENGAAACQVQFLEPGDLELTYTDRFDPPPRPRVKLTEYHLTASTKEERTAVRFVTVLRVRRSGDETFGPATLEELEAGYAVKAPLRDGSAVIRVVPGAALTVERHDRTGALIERIEAPEGMARDS